MKKIRVRLWVNRDGRNILFDDIGDDEKREISENLYRYMTEAFILRRNGAEAAAKRRL